MNCNHVLLNGTLCDERLWAHQVEHFSKLATVHIPALTQGDTIEGMAKRVLAAVPPQFGLAGFSMDGNVAFEIM